MFRSMAEQLRFPGFPEKPEENYWQYPRICNGWWHLLSGAEQKVLDYLLRHTWGYQKYQGDHISIKQFMFGIKNKKTGEIVDKGTGLSKQEVIDSLKELEEKSFVEKIGNKRTGKTNYYKLKLQPVKKLDTPCQENRQVGCQENRHTINNVTINNRQYITKVIEKPLYGNKEINDLILLLKEKFNLSILDGSDKENRRYCWLALKKFKKEGIELIIGVGSKDTFWANKITGFKTLYYNGVKIASTIKGRKANIIAI